MTISAQDRHSDRAISSGGGPGESPLSFAVFAANRAAFETNLFHA
jgi:hypothetical protein